ncbi:PQQ-dependent sugar dehydrogenase [Sphingomicrobium lutaoense]|uniref:Glucose/arabinose dehydrogenase n=1 Tax=Sphingomicrobium lutaoense TaxID=515949 RepID=A0A839Z0Y0_9SPHN|nr:PQQ-dependent sugar dehydrogenase [Sphingomicrobium lutaoense]MBB3763225.1 glucose/arabinose dehydrogenase [Sphingomicrobium lutaoense]
MMLMTSLLALAACTASGPKAAADNEASATDSEAAGKPFRVEEVTDFDEPWAAEFMPGTSMLFVTEKGGAIKWIDVATGRTGSVESGIPTVDYGGQGGLGDIAFAPDWPDGATSGGTLYLSFAEAGDGDTRGAALGRGTLVCEQADSCRLEGFEVIWRQDKVTGRGHYSHRIAFSPDGNHLFLTSGDRQKLDPAQDMSVNLGKVLRLTLDGQPAPGNPWADRGGRAAEFWSIGHRNLLGLDFAPDGRLWQIEMGPRHGDELNLIEPRKNYGWPIVSEGDHYDGRSIPDHDTRPEFEAPKQYWVPAISPASLLIYSGDLFAEWKADAIVPGLSGQSLSHVDIEGDRVVGHTDYDMGARIREVVQGPDGAIYLLEDERGDSDGTLLKLTPAR